jgi:hypothetical protein
MPGVHEGEPRERGHGLPLQTGPRAGVALCQYCQKLFPEVLYAK